MKTKLLVILIVLAGIILFNPFQVIEQGHGLTKSMSVSQPEDFPRPEKKHTFLSQFRTDHRLLILAMSRMEFISFRVKQNKEWQLNN